MVLRIILRYLANNEQLVHRLSESYPVRRAAQLVVGLFYRSKSMLNEQKLQDLTPEKFRSFIRTFKNNVKQEIEGAKEEFKNKKSNYKK